MKVVRVRDRPSLTEVMVQASPSTTSFQLRFQSLFVSNNDDDEIIPVKAYGGIAIDD